MTQVGADRPSPGNRICQPPACFAADPDLLRLGWGHSDSFDRYLQRAGSQDAAASAGTAAEPRSARPEPAPEREDRDTTDRAPAAPADAPSLPEAAEERVDNRSDGEKADTAAAPDSEPEPVSLAKTVPSDETRETHEDDQGEDVEATPSTGQPAAVLVEAPIEDPGAEAEARAEKPPSDGAKPSGQPEPENAKLDVEPAKRGTGAAPNPTDRTGKALQLDPATEAPAKSGEGEEKPNAASQFDPATEAPAEPPERDREPDETLQSEKPERKGEAKSPRKPVLPRADAPRQANATPKRADEPPGREVAPPAESLSEPDEPSGRSEYPAEVGEPKPRRVAPGAQEPPVETSAPTPSARRDAAPADAATMPVQSLPDDNDSNRRDEAQAQTAKPLRGPEPEPKADAPLRVTTEAQPEPSSARPVGPTAEPGQVDRARFVQRVARAFKAMGGRQGAVRLRLHPPELGSLRLEIHVRGGVMHARVEAENAAVRSLLLDQLPHLRDRLAQQDIKIQQFDVGLSDRSGGETSQQAAHQAPGDGERSGRGTSSSRPDGRAAPEDLPSATEAPTWPGEGGRLNVLI